MLFFDEADSILGKRLSNITQSTDHAVNVSCSVMLLELSKTDWECIILETKGLSGEDILNIIVNASSIALEREGLTCKVRLNDFITAIHSCKKAKEEI